jgi:ferric-dicitrate binding protein FerR (iron transport regulator)
MTPEQPDNSGFEAALRTLRTPELSSEVQRAVGDRLEAAARRRRAARVVRRAALAVGGAAAAAIVAVALLYEPAALVAPPHATRLRTGSGDFQLLPLGDRGVAFVSEDTDLELDLFATPALRIHRGSVRLVVRRRTDQPFVVATPAADVEVMGTEFDVTVVGQNASVKVVRGEVEVRNPLGRRRLWARESARVRPGEEPRMGPPVGVVTGGTPQFVPL